jgi:hypothetical protein
VLRGRSEVVFVCSGSSGGLTSFFEYEVPAAIDDVPVLFGVGLRSSFVPRRINFGSEMVSQVLEEKSLKKLFSRQNMPDEEITLSEEDIKEVLDYRIRPTNRLVYLSPERKKDLVWSVYRKRTGIKTKNIGMGLPRGINFSDDIQRRFRRITVEELEDMDMRSRESLQSLSDLAERLGLVLCVYSEFISLSDEETGIEHGLPEYLNNFVGMKNLLVLVGVRKQPNIFKKDNLPFKASSYKLRKPDTEHLKKIILARQEATKTEAFNLDGAEEIASRSKSLDDVIFLAEMVYDRALKEGMKKPLNAADVKKIMGVKKC